jgi:hypothetical protein
MHLLFSLAVTGALAQMFSPTLLPLKVYASGCEAGEYVVLAYKAGTSRDAPSSTDDATRTSTGKERSTRSRFWGMTTYYSVAGAGLGLLLVLLAVAVRRRHVRKQRRTGTQADCKVHVSPRPQPQRGQASRVSTSTARTKRPSVSESWHSQVTTRGTCAPADVIVPVGGLRQQSVVSMANPSGRCPESVGFKFCSWP